MPYHIITPFTALYDYSYLSYSSSMITSLKIFRCVKDSERVVAISVQSVMCRVFGAFPGPIILGAFIDKACILWNVCKCNF